MKRWLAILLPAFALLAQAHEVRPAYLELTEREAGKFDVLWKVPAMGGTPLAGEEIPHEQVPIAPADTEATKAMPCGCPAPTAAQLSRGVIPIHPSMPKDAVTLTPPRVERIFGAEIKRWTIQVPHGLDGWEVTAHGLEATMIHVLVRISFTDGRVVSRVLRPDVPSFVFGKEMAGPAAGGYFRLGVEHILSGIDHLLFVLALVLIMRGVRLLVKTITAFTVAHSITLALATLGYVHVPPAPVEAIIALSIVFLASEVLRGRRGERGLTERWPWLVAGTFGLLHGFGFAGALSEVGLPANDIPLALLFFNLGVEAGQLAFVAVMLALVPMLRAIRLPQWFSYLPPYAIGGLAMFWVIERTAAIW